MIRSLDKDNFLHVIRQRPAMMRHVKNPDDIYLARCINETCQVLNYIDKTWLTLPVLLGYIELLTRKDKVWEESLDDFPVEVRKEVPTGIIRKLCKKHPTLVRHFPNAPYDLFMVWAGTDYNNAGYDDIPEQHRTDELLGTLLASNKNRTGVLPEKAYTDGIVDKALSLDAKSIIWKEVPVKFLTRDRLKIIFEKNQCIEREDIPVEVWDDTLLDLAMKTSDNFRYIPEKFRTKPRCIQAVEMEGTNYLNVPDSLRNDEDILVTALTQANMHVWSERLPLKKFTVPLLLKLAKKDQERGYDGDAYGVDNYNSLKTILPEDWVQVLTICPKALKYVPKDKQTDAMMKAFFDNADMEVIDKMDKFVNLARVTKEYAPFLVGSTSKVFQGIVARKMNPIKRDRKEINKEAQPIQQVVTNAVSVDLTDSELVELSKRFKLL